MAVQEREGAVRWPIRVLAVVLFAFMGFAATGVGAELLRCKGPDGRMIYTDNKVLCPGAKHVEPRGEVHRAKGPDAPAASRSPLGDRRDRAESRRRAAEAEAGEARRWRRKREEGEEALRTIAGRRVELKEVVTWCNRGGSIVARDDAGIKQNVPCRQIRTEYTALDDEEAKIRAYLERGLAEECRRAGCLPGWIR
jgi:hypothetical protein